MVGVDIVPQRHYPYEFHCGDALSFPLDGFDVIHASPPCQAYSDLAKRSGFVYPELIEEVRERLSGVLHVIENVETAPLVNPMVLCGTMFPGLRVLRHRSFESNVLLSAPSIHPRHPLVFTYDRRKNHFGKLDQDVSFVQVTGGGNCSVRNARLAMGIDWMTKMELNEAIPPAYTEWVGRQISSLIL